MTVQKLIEELNKIENKLLPVCIAYEDEVVSVNIEKVPEKEPSLVVMLNHTFYS